MNEEQIRLKIEARLLDLKKAALCLDLGVGKISAKIAKEHAERLAISHDEINAERMKLMAALDDWEQLAQQ